MRFKLFEDFTNLKLSLSSLANKFLSDLSKTYDLRKGEPFDKEKGNCAWFTQKFSEWATANRIAHKIVYFPETSKAHDAHISPMVDNYVLDFAHKQFSDNPHEMFKISSPEEYRNFGYSTWEIYEKLPKLETVYSLDKI